MGKLLFLLLIAAIAWALFKKRQAPTRRRDREPSADAAPARGQGAEKMVACASCGVFMPESDSVLLNGRFSCRDPAHCAHRPS